MGDDTRALMVLGELAARSVALVVAAGVVSALLRRTPAAYRCQLWQMTLALLLLLPATYAALPRLRVPVLPPVASPVPGGTAAASDAARSAPRSGLDAARTSGPVRPPQRAEPFPPGTRFLSRLPAGFHGLPGGILAIWALGTALGLGSLVTGLLRAQALLRSMSEVDDEALLRVLASARSSMVSGRCVRLVMPGAEGGFATPMTTGLRRPTILLPHAAKEWSEERVRAVLLHELAHVERRDWPWYLTARLACALYWWNPLVWLAAERMRAEAEGACDDQVLAAGMPASNYAAHLMALAPAARRQAVPTTWVGMARESGIAIRIEAILGERVPRGPVRARWAAAIVAGAGLVLLPVSSIALAPRGFTPMVAREVASPQTPASRAVVAAPAQSSPVATTAPAAPVMPPIAAGPREDAAGRLAEVRMEPPPMPSALAPVLPPALAAPPAAPVTGRIVVGGFVQAEGFKIFALDPATGKLEVLVRHGGERVRQAPDRRTLAYERETDGEAPALLVGEVGNDKPRTAQTFVDSWISPDSRYPVWSPDGQSFLCSFAERNTDFLLRTYRFSRDGTGKTLLPLPDRDWVSDWSPNGEWLLTVSGRGNVGPHIYLMRTDGSQARRLSEEDGDYHWAPRFSPDGKRVLYTTSERPKDPKVPVHDALWVVDADGKNRRKVFSEPNVGALGAWSPDGRHLVVIRWDWSRDERGKGIDGKTYRAELLPVEGGASKVLARFPWMARLGMPDWR